MNALEWGSGHALANTSYQARKAAWTSLKDLWSNFMPLLADVKVARYRACRVAKAKMCIEATSRNSSKCNHVFLAQFDVGDGEGVEDWVGSLLLFVKILRWEGLPFRLLQEPIAIVRWYPKPEERIHVSSTTVGIVHSLAVQASWAYDDTTVGAMLVKDISGLVGLGDLAGCTAKMGVWELEGWYMVLGRLLVTCDLMSAE